MTIRTFEKLTLRDTAYNRDQDEPDTLAFFEGLQSSVPRLKHLILDSFCIKSPKVIEALARVHRLDSLTLVNTKIDMDGATLLVKAMGKLYDRYFLEASSLQTVADGYAPRCQLHLRRWMPLLIAALLCILLVLMIPLVLFL